MFLICQHTLLCNRCSSKTNGSCDHQIVIQIFFRCCHFIFQFQCSILQIRCHFYGCQADLRYVFTPYRFPDTGGLYIPASKVFVDPSLFSSWLLGIKRVFYFYRQFIFSVMHQIGNVKRASCIAASVASCIGTVYPYFCNKITALKVQDITIVLQLHTIYVNCTMIPDKIMAGFILNAA